jgi:heat shock protein HslJ
MKYFLSVSLLLMFSCSTVKNQADAKKIKPVSLKGSSWTLSKVPDVTLEKLKTPVTLYFSDSTNRINGYSGCNGFGGEYAVDGNALKLSKILGTLRACMPGMKTESNVYKALNNTDHYKIADGKLYLLQGSKVLAEFSPYKKE